MWRVKDENRERGGDGELRVRVHPTHLYRDYTLIGIEFDQVQ